MKNFSANALAALHPVKSVQSSLKRALIRDVETEVSHRTWHRLVDTISSIDWTNRAFGTELLNFAKQARDAHG